MENCVYLCNQINKPYIIKNEEINLYFAAGLSGNG
jgi:hypothetical protein